MQICITYILLFRMIKITRLIKMKYTFILTFILSFTSFINSQNTSGEIIYEEKVNIHKSLPPEMEAMKDRIPEFRENKKILYFNPSEALYVNKPKTEEEIKAQQEFRGEGRRGRGRRFRGNDNNKFYTNFSDKESIDSRNFFGKDFLITGERTPLKWKITGEQKQVGSYLCQKATYQDSTQNIEAWFTPMIPVSSGPDDYFGLPGLILHMDFDDGIRQITAIDIKSMELPTDAIVKPTKGKKVTKEEFDKIREEKIKEREEEFGRSGGGRRFGRGR